MKLQLETKNRTIGVEIDVDCLKYKFKKIVKNLLGALGFIALFLLGTMEVKENVSPLATMFIYFGLLAIFSLGIIVNND